MYSLYQFKKNQAKSTRALFPKRKKVVNLKHSIERVKEWVENQLQDNIDLQRILSEGTLGLHNASHHQIRDNSSNPNIYIRK